MFSGAIYPKRKVKMLYDATGRNRKWKIVLLIFESIDYTHPTVPLLALVN